MSNTQIMLLAGVFLLSHEKASLQILGCVFNCRYFFYCWGIRFFQDHID
jgi:hypothetical protein